MSPMTMLEYARESGLTEAATEQAAMLKPGKAPDDDDFENEINGDYE